MATSRRHTLIPSLGMQEPYHQRQSVERCLATLGEKSTAAKLEQLSEPISRTYLEREAADSSAASPLSPSRRLAPAGP
jgi:hypothetical protein